MTKEEWKNAIIEKCKAAGTYNSVYDFAIDTLAGIMEIKDEAIEDYEATGKSPVISYTNKAGHTNLRKNPALQVINDCNTQALAYWRDLGLTPSGFKKLDGQVVQKKEGTFEDILENIGI